MKYVLKVEQKIGKFILPLYFISVNGCNYKVTTDKKDAMQFSSMESAARYSIDICPDFKIEEV